MKYVGKVHSEYVRGILVEDYDRTITRVNDDGTTKQLDLRLDLANHSPTGFCWGYQGSGPAQAALAILADMFDDNFARLNYQILKRELIAGLPMDEDFVINDRQIRNALVSGMIESIRRHPVSYLPIWTPSEIDRLVNTGNEDSDVAKLKRRKSEQDEEETDPES